MLRIILKTTKKIQNICILPQLKVTLTAFFKTTINYSITNTFYMKKIFTLLTVMFTALQLMAAGTASDPYLNVTKYATIDEAGATVEGMQTIYKYTQQNGGYWLTLSNYGVMKTDETQNWFTNEMVEADNSEQYTGPWEATDCFQGPSAYFGDNTAYSARYKMPEKKQCFYVTFCTQVKQFVHNRSTAGYYLTKMNIYECTLNGDGTLNENATLIESHVNSVIGNEVLASGELDPEKIYKVEIACSYAYLYEIAFKTPGVFDGEIVPPVAYDVTDIVTHPVYPDNPNSDAILCEAFTCHWSPCAGAKSYTIRVYPSETQEGLIYREKFSNCNEGDVYEDYEHIDGHADNEGWYGRNISGVDGGVAIDVNGILQSPMSGIPIYRFVDKYTVKVKAMPYGDDTDCFLRLTGGITEQTIEISGPEKWYTFVMERNYYDAFSVLMSSYLFQNMSNSEDGANHRIVISDFKIYYGDYSESQPQNVASPKYIQPAWDGATTYVYNIPSDSTSFHFGYYTNAAGNQQIDMSIQIMDYAYYFYDVQAVYYDGQQSDWSNQIPICIKPWPEDLFIEDDDEPVETMEFYLVGTFNDWNQAEDGGRMAFTATGTNGVYETKGTLEDNAEFKVITPNEDGGWTWYGGADENGVGYFLINSDLFNQPITMVDGSNFRIEQGGEFTFRVNANNLTLTVLPVGNPGVYGDVNGDGEVTATDITCIYNYLLNGDTTYVETSDINGDGNITATDITCIYNILLGDND